jgi:hypothetical protein
VSDGEFEVADGVGHGPFRTVAWNAVMKGSWPLTRPASMRTREGLSPLTRTDVTAPIW